MAAARSADQEEVRRLRLRLLQWQIGPHFLCNTLSAAQAFVRTHPVLAEDLLGTLAQFVRTLVGRDDRPISVAEEMALIRVYLGLERVRLGSRLRTCFDIDPRVRGLEILPLILQPLVENAVLHAAGARAEGATVRLTVRYARRRRSLLLAVSDDGPGLRRVGAGTPTASPAGAAPGRGLGLANLRLRLAVGYGDGARLRLLSPPGGGTVAAVALPVPRRARTPGWPCHADAGR